MLVPLVIAILLMAVFMAGGMWLACALGIAAFLPLYLTLGDAAWRLIGMTAWETSRSFIFVAVPLFVFMAEVINHAGVAEYLFTGVNKLLKGLPGELFQATIAACAIFAALCGVSTVSAAAMGRLAYPQLVARGYDKTLGLGSICAGGTLAILIPPSIAMIIYGGLTGESVGKLFIGGIIPGIFVSLVFMTYVGTRVLANRKLAPVYQAKVNWRVRLGGLINILPMGLLITFVLVAIYLGVATPTEAGAVAVIGAVILAALYKRFSLRALWNSALSAVIITSFVFFIVVSAQLMGMVLGHYHIPTMLSNWAVSLGSPYLVLTAVCLFYLVLGCFFDAVSVMVITVGFTAPMVAAAGFDLLFFGIILVLLLEMCLLTPPVGINLYVMLGATGEPFQKVVRGSLPFVVLLVVCLIVLVIFPQMIMWLPSQIH